MILQSLIIQRGSGFTWDKDKPLKGTIKFVDDNGSVELNLSEAMAQRLLEIVADGVVESAQQVATQLTASVLTQVPTLTHAPGGSA
jgi:hypothetical protein